MRKQSKQPTTKNISNGEFKVEFVALHITRVCGHRCPFCYLANDAVKPKHPSLAKLKKVADALGTAGVKDICFLGGDPASYPHALDLAAHISHLGMNVTVLSNTHRYPHAGIEAMAQYVTAFETTIHHPDPAKHDAFCRSKGAYERVVPQLRRAHELGRKIGIAVNITPDTYDKLYSLVERMRVRERTPVDYVIVQRIVPFGRAAHTSRFTLNRMMAERALAEIRKIDKGLGVGIFVEDPFPLCILPEGLRQYMKPCQWGFTRASINEDGDVSRCGADPRYRLGNIFTTPLQTIWNTSEILKSFRSRDYLPGRCQTCTDLEQCGGGCPLSCEIEKDHGIDYLYREYQKLDQQVHGRISFGHAREAELSSILQIEWSDFPDYGHLFTVDSLKQWYRHNPKLFWVVRDEKKWVLGYAAIAPVSEALFDMISKGQFSSLAEFPMKQVLKHNKTPYFHVEVVATVPSRTASRAGRALIKGVGRYLIAHAKFVSASPITPIGLRLCKYFGFTHKADEQTGDPKYPIYVLDVDKDGLRKKLNRF